MVAAHVLKFLREPSDKIKRSLLFYYCYCYCHWTSIKGADFLFYHLLPKPWFNTKTPEFRKRGPHFSRPQKEPSYRNHFEFVQKISLESPQWHQSQHNRVEKRCFERNLSNMFSNLLSVRNLIRKQEWISCCIKIINTSRKPKGEWEQYTTHKLHSECRIRIRTSPSGYKYFWWILGVTG